MTISEVVNALCVNFDRQCDSYSRLWEITKKATGALAMSRGDFTKTLSILEEKESLLISIMELKSGVSQEISFWQEHKHEAPVEMAQKLELHLDKMEQVITRFLTAEKQLEKQITFYQKGMQ